MKNNSRNRPPGWRTVQLGDVAEVTRGLSWSRKQESSVALTDSVPVVRIGNVQSDGFKMDDTLHISGVVSAQKQKHLVTERTLVMVGSNGNPDRVGNVFLANEAISGHVLASFLIRVEPSLNVSERYVALSLRSERIQELITESTAGSTGLRNLSLEWLRTLPILLPPLAEQRAIAEVLDSIDAAIERTDDVIASTERLRDSLLHELLTRGVPGWHTSWRDEPGIGPVPASWEVVWLGDVAEANADNWDPEEGNDILYLDLTSVSSPGVLSEPRQLPASEAPSRARRRVVGGDILVSTVRPNLRGFARVTEERPDLVASTGFTVLTPRTHTSGAFLYHHVMSQRFANHLNAATTGQAYPAVRPSDVTGFPIALPPLEEQQAIAGMLDAVDAAVERAREERASLQGLKASASDALLTGRVRVGSKEKRED